MIKGDRGRDRDIIGKRETEIKRDKEREREAGR